MIRRANEADLPALEQLEAECFSVPWSLQILTESMANSYDYFWVSADENGGAAAYMNIRALGGEGELMRIAVSPSRRRQGLGKELMDVLARFSMEQRLTDVSLEVRAGNEAAINLYKSCGFRGEAVRRAYYREPTEDALIMWKRGLQG